MTTCRIIVMCSGNGSNLQAILDACASGTIPNTSVIKVFINRKKAFAGTRAAEAGVPCEYFNLISHGYHAMGEKDPQKLKEARSRHDRDMATKVLKEEADLIVLPGWMYIFSSSFLEPMDAAGIPVINLHPALPGQYDGINAIGRAHADCLAGKLEKGHTGVMAHYVVAEVDRGPPILVKEVQCSPEDSLDDLAKRIRLAEHDVLVQATAQLVQPIYTKKTA